MQRTCVVVVVGGGGGCGDGYGGGGGYKYKVRVRSLKRSCVGDRGSGHCSGITVTLTNTTLDREASVRRATSTATGLADN